MHSPPSLTSAGCLDIRVRTRRRDVQDLFLFVKKKKKKKDEIQFHLSSALLFITVSATFWWPNAWPWLVRKWASFAKPTAQGGIYVLQMQQRQRTRRFGRLSSCHQPKTGKMKHNKPSIIFEKIVSIKKDSNIWHLSPSTARWRPSSLFMWPPQWGRALPWPK